MHSAVEEQGSVVLGLLRLLGMVSGGEGLNNAKWAGPQGSWKGALNCVRTSECGGEGDRLSTVS